ncbi:ROK family protein [Nonomuraea sp. NPDC050310]|uniref:ROK family protein n=1 Tax=Nonomuraea sp. NPDC050310 TaxID=3154935 RepID=UPI0033D85457
MDCVIAIDVGGTDLKGGLVARDGTLLHLETSPTPSGVSPDEAIAAISAFADTLHTRAASVSPSSPTPASPHPSAPSSTPAAGGLRPVAVGLAVPGLHAPGVAVYSAAFGWRDVPAAAFTALDLPVALGHDVGAAGLAEAALGACRGAQHALFIPLGTGPGATLIVNGSPYEGDNGWAGQLAHIPVYPDGEDCRCGQRGCLALYCGARSIPARAGTATAQEAADLARACGDLSCGAPACAAWSLAVDALAIGLATSTLLLDPDLIVLGGGLSLAGDILFDPLRTRLSARLAFRPAPRLLPSALGALAGLHGAALLGWQAAA